MYSTYSCGRCGARVTKSTRVCPNCRATLSGIRCKGCGYVGGEKDFPGDRCPRCGKAVYVGSRSGSSTAASSEPKKEPCEKCGKKILANEWTCPHCGYTQWGMVIGMIVFALACIGGGIFCNHNMGDGFFRSVLVYGGYIFGVILLLVGISEAIKGLQAEKKYEE